MSGDVKNVVLVKVMNNGKSVAKMYGNQPIFQPLVKLLRFFHSYVLQMYMNCK